LLILPYGNKTIKTGTGAQIEPTLSAFKSGSEWLGHTGKGATAS